MVLIFGPSCTDSQFDPSPTYFIHRGYHFGQQCGIPERVAGDQLPETDRRCDPQHDHLGLLQAQATPSSNNEISYIQYGNALHVPLDSGLDSSVLRKSMRQRLTAENGT